MPDLSPASQLPLTDEARSRLDELVTAEVERVRDGLATVEFDSPVVAVAFLFTEDEDTPVVEYHYACTESVRDAAFSDSEAAGLNTIWGPADWGIEDYMEFESDERTELADKVAADLHGAGIEFCTPAVLEEICWRLPRADWTGIMDVSHDFAAWVSEHEINEEAHRSFRLTAPPAVFEQYRADRWFRFAPSDLDTFS